jgi:hypothetical protein
MRVRAPLPAPPFRSKNLGKSYAPLPAPLLSDSNADSNLGGRWRIGDAWIVEEGEVAFVLEDGSRHKSPSAAGSKVMGGKAVNGWRFWTVEGDEPPPSNEKPAKKSRKQKAAKTLYKTPNQQGMAEGKTRYFCSACMDGFVHDGTDEPEACPRGHHNDDPELNAPSGVEEAAATA